MAIRKIRAFLVDERAGATIEFVALMPAFMLLVFFIMEITIALFWIGSAEKAVQVGARTAVVSNFAVTGLTPTTNNALTSATYVYGDGCRTGACVAFTTKTCTGGTGGDCDADNFDAIVDRMTSVFTMLGTLPDPGSHVTIRYEYVGLGFAGGPIVPSVTVTLAGVPYGAVVTTILGNFYGGDSILTNLPTISVTLTGEDLNSAGA